MRCEFIEECIHGKRYAGRVCLHKAELCKMRLEIAHDKELQSIFTDEGYEKDGIVIRALGKPDFLAIIIYWRTGKTTLLSVREVKEKAWRKSTFPSSVKDLLERINNKFVKERKP